MRPWLLRLLRQREGIRPCRFRGALCGLVWSAVESSDGAAVVEAVFYEFHEAVVGDLPYGVVCGGGVAVVEADGEGVECVHVVTALNDERPLPVLGVAFRV